MRNGWLVLSVVVMVLFAGCSGPFGLGPSSPAPTESPTSQQTTTPTNTPSPTPEQRHPPGVTTDGIQNASRLLAAHVEALNQTGFIGRGKGNATVFRDGFLVDVQSEQRNRMEANGSTYLRERHVTAGPVGRHWEAWGNRSVEYRRTKEDGEWTYSQEPAAPVAVLAGQGLLRPYLQGGNYSVAESEEVDGTNRYTLVATEMSDPETLEEALPEAVDEVTAFEATVVVDTRGRIHSVRAVVDYVIQGQEATHNLDYTLEQVGDVGIDQPDWVEAAANTTANA